MKNTILNTRVWFGHNNKKVMKYGAFMTLVEAHQILSIVDTYFLPVDDYSKVLYEYDVKTAEESNNRWLGKLATQLSRYTTESGVKRGTKLTLNFGIEVYVEQNGRKVWKEWTDEFGQDIHDFTRFCLSNGINIPARLAKLDTLVVESETELA